MDTRRLLHLELVDGPDDEPADARRRHRHRVSRWLEGLLLVLGAVCLGYYLYVLGEARLYQSFEDRELDTILASRSASPAQGGAIVPRRPAPAPGSTVGRIEIPRLGV